MSRILKDVDLIEKADCYSKNLSGGQKRKLSVGIAFIGNPKVCLYLFSVAVLINFYDISSSVSLNGTLR